MDQLHHMPQQAPTDEYSPDEHKRDSRRLYRVEQQLLSFARSFDEEAQAYSGLAHAAAHFYVTRACRNLPSAAPFVRNLHHKLVQRLQLEARPSLTYGTNDELLKLMLWASCLAYDPHAVYPQHQLFKMMELLGVVSGEMLLTILQSIAWADGFKHSELNALVCRVAHPDTTGGQQQA
jgi:hypothetical protein